MQSFSGRRRWSSWRGILTASQTWAWNSVILSALVCAIVAALHLDHRRTLNQTVAGLDGIRLARLDLAQGLLHILMSQQEATPFDRHQGLALMRQSVDSFERETNAMIRSGEPVAKFRTDVSALRRQLAALNLQAPLVPDQAVRLRIVVHQVEQQADRLDAAVRSELRGLTTRLDRIFLGTLSGSGLLLGGVATAVFLADRARRKAEFEREHSIELLRASEERLRQVLDALPVAAYTCDSDGLITYFNARAVETWGRSPELLAPASRYCGSLKLYNADGTEITHENSWMAVALRERQTIDGREAMIERPDGSRRLVLAYARPLITDSGVLHGAVNVLDDITERRRTEERLARQQAELLHVSRLSTVGQMVAALSHEVAQPLTAISNFAAATQTLLENLADAPGELRDYIAEINRQSLRAGTILQHLRDYSRKTPVRHAACDLNEVVRDSVALTASEFRRRQVRIDWTTPACALTTEGDRIQLQQVIVNLLTNAADAMQNLEPSERLVRLRTWQEGDAVFAEVADCGPGIPEEHLGRVFDPFFTTKSHGMGIGLSICRTIINDHGGAIEAVGDRVSGATFQVRMPLFRYAHAG